MTEELDIPAFLKIDAARRKAAWDKLPRADGSRRDTPQSDALKPWNDPGSVARNLGYPESEAEREARLLYHAARREERDRIAIVQERRQEQADDEQIQRSLREHRRELRAKELKQGRVQKVTRK